MMHNVAALCEGDPDVARLLSGVAFPDDAPPGSIIDAVDALSSLISRDLVADDAGIGFVPIDRLREMDSSDESSGEEVEATSCAIPDMTVVFGREQNKSMRILMKKLATEEEDELLAAAERPLAILGGGEPLTALNPEVSTR